IAYIRLLELPAIAAIGAGRRHAECGFGLIGRPELCGCGLRAIAGVKAEIRRLHHRRAVWIFGDGAVWVGYALSGIQLSLSINAGDGASSIRAAICGGGTLSGGGDFGGRAVSFLHQGSYFLLWIARPVGLGSFDGYLVAIDGCLDAAVKFNS